MATDGRPAPPPRLPPAAAHAAGALARTLRLVYRKAAAAAEARAQALLDDHLYHLHGRRALVIVLDGGGTTLMAGTKLDLEVPWAYQVEGWALYSPLEGSVVVDLQRCAGFADYPAGLASICGAGRPTLDAEQKHRSEDVSEWGATALARGNVVRVLVDTVEDVTLVTLTLFVRAV